MFDYGSLTDVIIHLSYVARYDDALAQAVERNIVDQLKTYAQLNGLFRLVSMRHEFPSEFYQLLNPQVGQASKTGVALERKHFRRGSAIRRCSISDPVVVWPQAVKGQDHHRQRPFAEGERQSSWQLEFGRCRRR
jgi:hypothetical protein